jgi:hypothetical protein
MSVPVPTSQVTANNPATPYQRLKNSFLGDQMIPGSSNSSVPQAQDVQALAQAVPMAVNDMTDSLNPSDPKGSSVKEMSQPGITLERPVVDQIPGVQYVEEEKGHEKPEIPPEVEGYIQQVENHQDQIPQEIVIGDQQSTHPSTKYLATPVIVLPITAEEEKAGAHKSSQFSIRWLVEWSRKVMKVFSGRVVYRQDG